MARMCLCLCVLYRWLLGWFSVVVGLVGRWYLQFAHLAWQYMDNAHGGSSKGMAGVCVSHVKNAQVHYSMSPHSEHPYVEAVDQQPILFVSRKIPLIYYFWRCSVWNRQYSIFSFLQIRWVRFSQHFILFTPKSNEFH